MNQIPSEKNNSDGAPDDLQRLTTERDMLLMALVDLLEHEGTVDYTGIGEMPSEALGRARAQAFSVIAQVKGEQASGSKH